MAIALVDHTAGNNNKTSGTTIDTGTWAGTGPNAIGDLVVVGVTYDNLTATTPVISSLSVPTGETATWTIVDLPTGAQSAAAGCARGSMAYLVTTQAWASTDSVTVTLSGAVTAKAAIAAAFSGTGSSTNQTVSGASLPITTASAMAVGELAVGFAFTESNSSPGLDPADFTAGWSSGTTGGSAATNVFGALCYFVRTASGTQKLNDIISDGGGIILCFPAGAVNITGTLASTEAADTVAITGVMQPSGTLAATEAADQVSATGSETISGTLAATEATDTVAASGAETFSGTLAATATNDTVTASGAETFSGTLAATGAADSASMSGTVVNPITGTLAATEAADTVAVTAAEKMSGTLASTEGADVVAMSGSVGTSNATGTMVVTEAADAVAATGAETFSGTLAATEAADTAAGSGTVANPVSGTLAATEASDSVAMAGTLGATGIMAVTEAGDVVAATGGETIPGSMAAVEGHDTVAFAGQSLNPITGTAAVTDARDTVAMTGLSLQPITGTAAVVNGGDSAAFVVNVHNPVYVFTPPTHEEPMRTEVAPIRYYRLTYASSILRVNGNLVPMRTPPPQMVTAAGTEGVDYFRGGCRYEVSAATKAELESLGYTVETQ